MFIFIWFVWWTFSRRMLRVFYFPDRFVGYECVGVSVFGSDCSYREEVLVTVRADEGARFSFTVVLDVCFYIGELVVFKSRTEVVVVSVEDVRVYFVMFIFIVR